MFKPIINKMNSKINDFLEFVVLSEPLAAGGSDLMQKQKASVLKTKPFVLYFRKYFQGLEISIRKYNRPARVNRRLSRTKRQETRRLNFAKYTNCRRGKQPHPLSRRRRNPPE